MWVKRGNNMVQGSWIGWGPVPCFFLLFSPVLQPLFVYWLLGSGWKVSPSFSLSLSSSSLFSIVFPSSLFPWCWCALTPQWQDWVFPWGEEGSLGLIVGGSRGLCSCCSCFMWMYLEWTCSLTCPPSLWRYQVPGFSTSGGLSPCLNSSTLGNFLPFPCDCSWRQYSKLIAEDFSQRITTI